MPKNIKDSDQLRRIIERRKANKPNFKMDRFLARHSNDQVFQNAAKSNNQNDKKAIYDLITRNPGLSNQMGAPSATGDFSSFLKNNPFEGTVAQAPKGIGGSAPQGKWIKGVATSFWDTGNSGYGDTGAPASGSPMQFHMVASPYLPMGTRLKVQANGKTINAFVGDMGPGAGGKLLDLSAPAASYLYGRGMQQARTSTRDPVKYQITGWGTGNTLYKNSSQARKYASKYGSLKKYKAPKDRVKWDDIPDYYYNWRG